jgi:hypothetical protein
MINDFFPFNFIKVSQINYLTPHGNELFQLDHNDYDGDPDDILLFATLYNQAFLPIKSQELHLEFWVATSSFIYTDENEDCLDIDKMQSQARWTKVLDKNINNIRAFKPYESRKVFVEKINLNEALKKANNTFPLGYRSRIVYGSSHMEMPLNIAFSM